jgi:hypothetical protein
MLRLQQGFATGEMGFNINLRCKNPERSLSALGLGCSLIPGARWQGQSRRFGDMADGFSV